MDSETLNRNFRAISDKLKDLDSEDRRQAQEIRELRAQVGQLQADIQETRGMVAALLASSAGSGPTGG